MKIISVAYKISKTTGSVTVAVMYTEGELVKADVHVNPSANMLKKVEQIICANDKSLLFGKSFVLIYCELDRPIKPWYNLGQVELI